MVNKFKTFTFSVQSNSFIMLELTGKMLTAYNKSYATITMQIDLEHFFEVK